MSLSVRDMRAICIAYMEHDAPAIFSERTRSGLPFRASERWVADFVVKHCRYKKRTATRAAQKIPCNWEAQLRGSLIRQIRALRDFSIPAVLRVNFDQTQVQLHDNGKVTYHPIGDKQVSVHGIDEKRAFTILASVSASGVLLPFQAIYKGYTNASLPTSAAPRWAEAVQLGFHFAYGGHTYWSTQQSMCDYVTEILVPYLQRAKEEEDLDPEQEALVQLDCWSVHRSDEFRGWLERTYPWIKIDFVPGGCTGIWQPCDVGIQRGLKHVIRQCQHADVVAETVTALDAGKKPEDIRLEQSLPVLRNRTVAWMVQAYHQMNDPKIVQKVRTPENDTRMH